MSAPTTESYGTVLAQHIIVETKVGSTVDYLDPDLSDLCPLLLSGLCMTTINTVAVSGLFRYRYCQAPACLLERFHAFVAPCRTVMRKQIVVVISPPSDQASMV